MRTIQSATSYSMLAGGTDPAGLPAHNAPTGPSSAPVTTTLVSTGRRDGGFAEVSGKAVLDYAGFADLSAQNGRFGSLLLDPYLEDWQFQPLARALEDWTERKVRQSNFAGKARR